MTEQNSLQEILSLFGSTFQNVSQSQKKIPVDVVNEEKYIYVYAETPGVQKDDISIDFYNNKLTIITEKKRAYIPPQVSELKYGRIERGITLPICVTRPETVSSVYKDGVLKIRINKLLEEENKFSIKPRTEEVENDILPLEEI